jgi:uncharacterized protein YukE
MTPDRHRRARALWLLITHEREESQMTVNQMWAGEGSLGHAASMVADARVDLDRVAAALTARIAAHQGRWQGAGGQAFFVLQQAWTDKQTTIVAALAQFEDALVGTEAANAATDDEATSLQRVNLDRLHGIAH